MLDLVLDSGRIVNEEGTEDRRGSTVVDLSKAGRYHIVRRGM